MKAFASLLVVLFLARWCSVEGLDNGVGLTPPMGYNSWYDLFMEPNETVILDTAQALIDSGLFQLGYKFINLDDGIVVGRDSQGILVEDRRRFPSGFPSLSRNLHRLGFKFGVYTDRGTLTCGGRPGSYGYEAIDAKTYSSRWEVDYVKEDSCYGSSEHDVAYSEYSLMRDALNETGRPIFFSLCGWNSWYASVGQSLGNSWRVGQDDSNWNGILANLDVMAPLWSYSAPGGWNDPCLLLGRDSEGKEAVTDLQGRAQFSMWAVLAAPMLLSQNVRNLTTYQLQTYKNVEVIEVGQDRLGRQGQRVYGGPLHKLKKKEQGISFHKKMKEEMTPTEEEDLIPLTLQACTNNPSQVWKWNDTAPYFLTNPQSNLCANIDNCGTDLIAYPCVTTGGTCAGPNSYINEQFSLLSDNTFRSAWAPQLCVTGFGPGHRVELQSCQSIPSQHWQWDPTHTFIQQGDYCLTVGGPLVNANIWARPLADGSYAFVFFHAGDSDLETIACDKECLIAATNWDPMQLLRVRDLWTHTDLPNVKVADGLNAPGPLPANGGSAMLRVWPIF